VRKALQLEPRLRTARYNLARVHEARGDAAAAEADYRAELETYPDNGRARFNLAQLQRARGDREGYLAELHACVEKAADFGACHWFLAREELNAGRLEAASDLAQRGLQAQPFSEVAPLGHYVMADVYNRQGQPAKAQQEVVKAQKLEAALKRHPPPRL
jgi:tetratricopeptide (TPR) repeat protein